MMAGSLLDTLREGCPDEKDCIVGLKRASRFDDSEPTERAELTEQAPHTVLFYKETQHHMLLPNPTYCG